MPTWSSLSPEDVLRIHEAIRTLSLKTADPIVLGGPREVGFVESAVSRPDTSLGTTYKYPTAREKAAALFHSIVAGHIFHDGNKRAGVASLAILLHRNGWYITATDDEVFDMVVAVAAK